MQDQRHGHGSDGSPGDGVTRALWVAALLPAVAYGAIIGRLSGAVAGVLIWIVVAGLAIGVRRHLEPRHDDGPSGGHVTGTAPPQEPAGRAHRDTPVGSTRAEQELFAELVMEPCSSCGTPTLLGTCLDCAQSSPRHRRGAEGAQTGDGDDPDD